MGAIHPFGRCQPLGVIYRCWGRIPMKVRETEGRQVWGSKRPEEKWATRSGENGQWDRQYTMGAWCSEGQESKLFQRKGHVHFVKCCWRRINPYMKTLLRLLKALTWAPINEYLNSHLTVVFWGPYIKLFKSYLLSIYYVCMCTSAVLMKSWGFPRDNQSENWTHLL